MKKAYYYYIILSVIFVFTIFLGIKSFSQPIQEIQSIVTKVIKHKETTSSEVVSFVSPHHLAAKGLIDEIFQKVAAENKSNAVTSIILVSPNHKNAGNGWVAVSGETRTVENATWAPNEKLVKFLTDEKLAYQEDDIFHGEHGIENLVPYARKYFPDAAITPLIIRDGFPDEQAQKLAEKLAGFDSGKTILILSADFSHYVGKTASEFHDQKAISVLSNLDLEKAKRMDIDCQGGLYFLMKYSSLRGCEQFNLVNNSNSASIYGQDFILDNTSYVTGYYSDGPKKQIDNTSLLFAGDVMLDREIRTAIQKKGVNSLTEKMKRYFLGPDEVILNLEGTVTKNASVSQGTIFGDKGHMRFTFNQDATKSFLKNTNSQTVFLGNNHIWDFGEDGYAQTKSFLAENNIGNFGDVKMNNEPIIRELNGKKVAFVAFNQFLGQPAAGVATKISQLKKEADFLIVYAHWGTEYERLENEHQKEWAHSFIDAGADLIIGSHPHVVEPIEVYKNKAIFYSLGNFVFDQYFSVDTMSGLAVGVSIQGKALDFYLSPVDLNRDGSTTLAEGKNKDGLLSWLAENSSVPDGLKDTLRSGHFQIENK